MPPRDFLLTASEIKDQMDKQQWHSTLHESLRPRSLLAKSPVPLQNHLPLPSSNSTDQSTSVSQTCVIDPIVLPSSVTAVHSGPFPARPNAARACYRYASAPLHLADSPTAAPTSPP
ncbi:uncharacterized protein EI90DRAFT_3129525 [Cantharellus anzutake]|uniref:uncharacterized protein n=1 Tax=Cantharellus anzutake TaxID=1750568 RepID=UPI0019070AE6|nr:uncharacterized protein EI90DRAFT_3129525 [Cantharellus anzutake]KAF8324781.1 hypothetical protein EI90DRAFT_3129525 [Cantharellus anzutake]